ncbi:ras-related protein rab-5c [Anaeramoeba flamelloides]|uniref:Ras-related protein rab-5c n=1 Tax=Anaeramoeba flamelloides TaxID=1746091 RepID=A0AAV8A6K0_9EUKA|nr:ras-related protein rab-5c [Anaeramoeba flamelloides]KAJ6243654.1 ras-related protein rab-5c [Anaeramoeba flamelloides]
MSIKLPTYSFKIVVLGESAVGKTSILLRFHKNQFSTQLEPTIGASHVQKSINMTDCHIQLLIWDTAGQEQYHSLAPMYYRGARGALIVYDRTNYKSFERAKDWIKELKSKGSPNVRIVLVGNKIDLETNNVDTSEALTYAKENDMLFFETSAKTGEGIQEAFLALVKLLPKKDENDENLNNSQSNDNFLYLHNMTQNKKKKKSDGCC